MSTACGEDHASATQVGWYVCAIRESGLSLEGYVEMCVRNTKTCFQFAAMPPVSSATPSASPSPSPSRMVGIATRPENREMLEIQIARMHGKLSSTQESDLVFALTKLAIMTEPIGLSCWSLAAGLGLTKTCRELVHDHWLTSYSMAVTCTTSVFAEQNACARSFLRQQHPEVPSSASLCAFLLTVMVGHVCLICVRRVP